MVNLLPPLDVIDPESFMAETISILSGYPEEVVARAVHEIPRRTDRPTLRLIKSVCEELFAPIEREMERASRNLLPSLERPKRTPEQQARVDAQVASMRQEFAEAAIRNGLTSGVDPPP